MENFKGQEYRNELAHKLKDSRSEGEEGRDRAVEILESEKNDYSRKYWEAKSGIDKQREFKKNEQESQEIMGSIEKLRVSLSPIIKKELGKRFLSQKENGVEIFKKIEELTQCLQKAGYGVEVKTLDKFIDLSEEEKKAIYLELNGQSEKFARDIEFNPDFKIRQEVFNNLAKEGNINDATKYVFNHMKGEGEYYRNPIMIDKDALINLIDNAWSGIYYRENKDKKPDFEKDGISREKAKEIIEKVGANKAIYYGGVFANNQWVDFSLDL
jgi:hypothetical protein